MTINHEAIYSAYSTVHHIYEDEDGTFVCKDINGNTVSVDITSTAYTNAVTTVTNAANLAELRAERNKRLEETDHWAYQDTPDMTTAQTNYRQSLRDITNTYSSLDTVVWPTKP